MKGTIVIVEKSGTYQNMVINEVTFKHGEKVKFFTKKTSANPEGDMHTSLRISESELNGYTFEYELTPTGNGKVVREDSMNGSAPTRKFGGGSGSTNDSILLQVCYKENMQAYGKDFGDQVLSGTVEHFEFLRNYLNNIK